MHGGKYYFCVAGIMWDEIEPTQGDIEMNIKTNIPAGGGWGSG